MADEILEFADQFPVVEYDPERPEPPQVSLIPLLIELLEIAGYAEGQIHQNVEKEIPDDAYEPSDVKYTESLTFSAYIAEDRDASAHIVGYEDPVIPPLSGDGLDHADYERMRVRHEVADAEITLGLTPYDLLIYDGMPLYAGNSPEPPITTYPLHEGFDSELARDLQEDLEPPSDLS